MVTVKKLELNQAGKGKSVKSSDPRKKVVTEAFKDRIAGVTKVTMVSELTPGVFTGHCMNATTGESHGVWEITGVAL